MTAALPHWSEPELPPKPSARPWPVVTPGEIPQGVWRGSELGSQVAETVPSGWAALDAQLPGGGWPRRSLTEVLTPQPAVCEWRLLGGVLGHVAAAGGQVVLVGPPKPPHLPGLLHAGIGAAQVIWVKAETPAERLWVTEQMIKSDAAGAIVAWLPQARQEQIRRLQVCALTCKAPVFLCRPEAARHDSSAAPLRLHTTFQLDWELEVDIFKRRGPAMDASLRLPSIPGGLSSILTPRLLTPSRLTQAKEASHAVGSPAPRTREHALH
ncbi:translesion DNA synthesis-associated protein ImuA [Pseudacidovorax intermedius]|uniref:translesion DNA synthesis-associated protein ImuA n=1 Tax=Pseudacidovorax intermedius TaxID=433924 RepID=UPI0005BCC070|nr:translesion DNA synthesis-associated protein ImuA [Pseudacidovorax intermedius]